MRKFLLFTFMLPCILYGQGENSKTYKNYILGLEALKQDNFRKAISFFKKDIKQNPTHFEAYYFLGISQNNHFVSYSKKQGQAIKSFDQYIASNPNDPRGYLRRGMVYYGLMKQDLALQDFKKSIELNPTIPEAYYYNAILRLKRFSKEEIAQCNQSLYDFKIFFTLVDSTHFLYKSALHNQCVISTQCGYYCNKNLPVFVYAFIRGLAEWDTTKLTTYETGNVLDALGIVYIDKHCDTCFSDTIRYIDFKNIQKLSELIKDNDIDSFSVLLITLKGPIYFWRISGDDFNEELIKQIEKLGMGEMILFSEITGRNGRKQESYAFKVGILKPK